VKKVVKNPLNINEIDQETEEENTVKPKDDEDTWSKFVSYCYPQKKEKKEDVSKQMETRILELSLKKLCNLLVIGVGEAGKDVII